MLKREMAAAVAVERDVRRTGLDEVVNSKK
jgi:hypothetical protein